MLNEFMGWFNKIFFIADVEPLLTRASLQNELYAFLAFL